MSAIPLYPVQLSRKPFPVIPGNAPLVSPVIDCEPPASDGPRVSARPQRPRRIAVGPAPAAPEENRDQLHAAATFADAALRRVLEVVDRRRPLAQLRSLLAAGLVDSLLSGATAAGGPARLRRVRAQLCRRDGTAAEVAAYYTRGERVHALACRVEQQRAPTGPRWQVVALHLG